MARCEDCGCGMSGGFCSNCHEEVFIAEQYTEMKMEIPPEIGQKATEHINNPNRIEFAEKLRKEDQEKRIEKHHEFFGEYPR